MQDYANCAGPDLVRTRFSSMLHRRNDTVMSRALVELPDDRAKENRSHWFARYLDQRWQKYWDGRRRQVTVMILRSLDERTLRDIGVDRVEIASLVDNINEQQSRFQLTRWPFAYKY
jgi:uncharacterized protein YjiS (DUF1127 family)